MRYESKKGENVEDKSPAEHYATDYGQMAHPSFGCFFSAIRKPTEKIEKTAQATFPREMSLAPLRQR